MKELLNTIDNMSTWNYYYNFADDMTIKKHANKFGFWTFVNYETKKILKLKTEIYHRALLICNSLGAAERLLHMVQLLNYYDNFDFGRVISNKVFKIIKTWDTISKSPYSDSFYNSDDIDWDYKPDKSLRISDHWNFISRDKKHCKLDSKSDYCNDWLLCQYDSATDTYHILQNLEG